MDLRVKGQFSRKETDLGQGTDLELRIGPRGWGGSSGEKIDLLL